VKYSKYSDSSVSCAKLAELIEMPFEIWTRVGPRKRVLGVNRTEPSMCSGDVACCHITLTTCLKIEMSAH